MSRLEQLEKLYKADQADPFVTYGIALEHAKLGRYEKAIAWLDTTLRLDPHYHYAYFQKAQALSDLGRDDEARAAAQAGLNQARAADDEKARGELEQLLATL